MPTYYFHVRSTDLIKDVDGTELANQDAAHATGIARELMDGSDKLLERDRPAWSMAVHNEDDEELFSFPFSDVESGDGGDGRDGQ